MAGKKVSGRKQISTNDYWLNILNYLGSALIFFGISYFIFANWDELSNAIKIICTLGIAIFTFIVAAWLQMNKKYLTISSAFFLISALVLPIGINVVFDILDVTWTSDAIFSLISAICFCVFGYGYFYFRQTILMIFAFIFASIFFMSFVNFIAYSFTSIHYMNLSQYELIILGLSYTYLGTRLQKTNHDYFVGPLFFLGCLFTLDGAYFLGPLSVTAPYFIHWKGITAIFIALSFYAAIQLKSKSFLYLSAIYFFLYLTIISRYFSHLLGSYTWPLFLIIVGLLFILCSYLVIYLRKKII